MKTILLAACFIGSCICAIAQNIKQVEYFIDKDKGVGKNIKLDLPSSPDSSFSFKVDLTGVTEGYHKLYIRTKSSDGKWSFTARRNIEVIASPLTNKIIKAEYFFDKDKGYNKATSKIFTDARPDGTFQFKIPYNKIPSNADTLFVRIRDSVGNWSITKFTMFSIQPFLKDTVSSDVKISFDNINRLLVYPNPASQTVNINFHSKNKSASLQIFDVDGKVVMQAIITANNTHSLNISKLVAGTFILQLNDGTRTYSTKLIKQ